MFTVDPTIADLKVKEKSILKVLFSMNTHKVATPEMNLEEARSYVIFCREGSGRISAYIGLHLLDTNRRLFYPHSSNPFPEEDMDVVDEEARGFADGLGAMLDEIDIKKMSAEEKNHWIDDHAIFNLKKKNEAEPAEQIAAQATGSLEQPAAPAVQPQEAAAPAIPVSTTSVAQPAPVVQPQEAVAPAIPVSTTSVAQPAPVAQPQEAAAPAIPVSTTSVAQPAPVAQPQEATAPAAPVSSTPVPVAPESFPQQPVQPKLPKSPVAAPTKAAPQVSAKRPGDVIERAIKAGVVKAPNPKLDKEIRGTNGIVSRDKEALARLLSSF